MLKDEVAQLREQCLVLNFEAEKLKVKNRLLNEKVVEMKTSNDILLHKLSKNEESTMKLILCCFFFIALCLFWVFSR